jgi:hypothetical protein
VSDRAYQGVLRRGDEQWFIASTSTGRDRGDEVDDDGDRATATTVATVDVCSRELPLARNWPNRRFVQSSISTSATVSMTPAITVSGTTASASCPATSTTRK